MIQLLISLLIVPALAFEPPANDGFVTDAIGILEESQDGALERTLSEYKEKTSNEIAILIVDSLHGEAIEMAAIDVGRKWGVGTKNNDNGILILVAYEDRNIFLSVGYGLEGVVPDLIAASIIETDITPHFRNGDYFQGIVSGIDALQKHIGGEYTVERYSESEGLSVFLELLIFFFFIFFEVVLRLLARTKSWWLGGVLGAVLGFVFLFTVGWWLAIPILTAIGLLLDYIVSKHGVGRRGGGFFGGGGRRGGGGGFGGFSGGSFGGGGAGGSW